MKKILVLLPLFALMLIVPVMAGPIMFIVPIHQATFQWRAWNPMPIEGSSWGELYQNYDTEMDCAFSGKVVHTYYEYSPVVEQLEGESTIYAFDAKSGLWIKHEGTVKYKYPPYYGDHWIVNYFRGYLNFSGEPGETTFKHGVAYQWVYLAASQEDGGILPHAQWNPVMGMWLLGFQIYLWDADTITQSYTMNFHFIEPVPASNYNPLTL